MQILRHSKIAVTMETYTEVPATRDPRPARRPAGGSLEAGDVSVRTSIVPGPCPPSAELAPAWIGFAGAAQVAQLRRTVTRNGRKTVEVVYLITVFTGCGT